MPRASSTRSGSGTSCASTRSTKRTSRRSRWRARSGFRPSRFKTLVCRGDRTGPLFAVVPAPAELDFKAIARLSGDRAVEMAPLREVQPLTGYIRGGVTVLGARKDFPCFADETVELFDVISVSAGVRGTQLLLSPADYLRATNARTGALTR